ncbi:MAG: glycosyltransferase family 2 protein [Candidatus Caldarchaeum sp.]|nr:glycosyltransferase [Candidatus Caldarchaeum sp.]MDW8062600.1 glycosyltransferase family 2 protein [Candidatus Caldarchaeum sp.]MDW8435629.1 glycosyltransferase family 2 protein [Candidatus Caldarchaeum sp.]
MLENVAVFASVMFVIAWTGIFAITSRILGNTEDLPKVDGPVRGKVSIVLPVRNEEKYVAKSLSNILGLRGVEKEVIVVDDNSDDATWQILQHFVPLGVKAVRAGIPPEGWMGKSWACHVGYTHSTGDWLLFTDADTEFSADVVKQAVCVAEERGLEFVSAYPRFRMNSLLHRFTMPILLVGFYIFGKPHLVKYGKSAFAFGSFILVRRDAYERLGGHYGVKDAVLEDRALALAAQRASLRTDLFKAFDRLVSSWNDDSKSLWNGMIRIFLPLSLKNPVKTVSVFALLTAVCLAIPILTILTESYYAFAAAHAAAAVAAGLESRRHSASFLHGLLWPIGVFAIMSAALTALVKSRTTPTVVWRGREYLIEAGEHHEKAVVISRGR